MNEYVAILGTLGGVVVGGLLNFLVTRSIKQQEWRLSIARDQLTQRQSMYAAFLAEIQRLTAQRLFRQLEVPQEVHELDRLIAQMNLLSPEAVIEASKNLRRHLLRNASAASETQEEGPTYNQLSRAFIEAAKADLDSYRSDA